MFRLRRVSRLNIIMVLSCSTVVIGMVLIFMHRICIAPDTAQITTNIALVEPVSRKSINHASSPSKTKLMFFKTHKCGTSSLVSLLYLYGVRRDLNFVLTPYEHQFHYDAKIQTLKTGQHYGIMCQHHRKNKFVLDSYRPSVMHQFLPKNETFYFTILREPQEQFVSNFIFYNISRKLPKIRKLTSHMIMPIETVIELYLNASRAPPEFGIVCTNAINPMAYDLGFPRFLHNKLPHQTLDQIIDKFLSFLDLEFDLVMIMDYFDESLLMLKSYQGWKIEDIVYLKKMTRSTGDKKPKNKTISSSLEAQLKKHNYVDHRLYDHFKNKFLQKLETFSKAYLSDGLQDLKTKQAGLVKECLDTSITLKSNLGTYFHPLSDSGIRNATCRLLVMKDVDISKALAGDQDPNFSEDNLRNMKLVHHHIPDTLKLFQEIREDYSKSLVSRNCTHC